MNLWIIFGFFLVEVSGFVVGSDTLLEAWETVGIIFFFSLFVLSCLFNYFSVVIIIA